MRSAQHRSQGWFVESGRWEPPVAIILGLLLTVALGRVATAARTVITPGDGGGTGVSTLVVSSPASR